MKAALLKRVESLEERQVIDQRLEEQRSRQEVILQTAIAICYALTVGGKAKEELDAADSSMDPKRRAKLEEHVAAARSIATTLETGASRRETLLSAARPGSLDALLAAVI